MINIFRDESGIWWFIGCRGFKTSGNNGKPTLKYFTLETNVISDESDEEKKKKQNEEQKAKSDYTKLRMCRFCQIGYPVSDLSH